MMPSKYKTIVFDFYAIITLMQIKCSITLFFFLIFSAMFSQLMETAEPWFSTFEHDGQKVNFIVQIFVVYLSE
jgi:hypothetical protein